MNTYAIRRKSDGTLWNYLTREFTPIPEFGTAEYLSSLDMTRLWLLEEPAGAGDSRLDEVEIVQFELVERYVIEPRKE